MLTNADITIYNRKCDKGTRLNTWRRTLIRSVHIYVDHKVSAGESGMNSAEVYKIRIPAAVSAARQYLSAEEYAACKDVSGRWTIQNEDYVVLGDCQAEIEKPADFQRLAVRYCKIVSWSDNRFGGLPHWRIGGI